MRRILIVPSVSHSSVAYNLAYQELYSFTETVVRLGERAFFYMVIPPWVREGLKGHENLQYIHLETTRDVSLNDVVGYSAFELAELFSRRGGKYVIDGVITNCIQFAVQLNQFLSDSTREPIPIFIRDIGNVHRKAEKKKIWKLSVALNLASNHFCVTSKQHKKEVNDFIRSCIQPTLARSFNEGVLNWPRSSDLDYLDGCVKAAERSEKITVFCGGEPTLAGFRKVLPIYRKLYALGSSVIISSTSSASRVKNALPDRDTSYIEDMRSGLTPDAYYLDAAKGHLFISVGKDEMTFHDEMERMVLGQVGVFPYEDFISEILGDGYPFYYTLGNYEEAYEMASWVVDNYKQAVKKIKTHVKKIRKIISNRVVFEKAWSQMKDQIDDGYMVNKMKSVVKDKRLPLFNTVQKVAEGLGDEFAMMVYIDVLEENVPWLKPWRQKGTLQKLGRVRSPLPTVYDVREMLDNLGWKDTCDGGEIMLKRIGKPKDGVFDEE